MKELTSLSIKGEKIINVWKIRKNVENNKLESSPGLWKFPEGGFSGCSAQSAAKILSPPLEKSPPPLWILNYIKLRSFMGWEKEYNWLEIFSKRGHSTFLQISIQGGGETSPPFSRGGTSPWFLRGGVLQIPPPISRHCQSHRCMENLSKKYKRVPCDVAREIQLIKATKYNVVNLHWIRGRKWRSRQIHR